MPVKSFAVRLGVEGEAEVKRAWEGTSTAAERAYERTVAAATAAGRELTEQEEASQRKRQEAIDKSAARAKASFEQVVAASQSANRTLVQEWAAAANAQAPASSREQLRYFSAARTEALGMQQQAERLRAVLDPVAHAQAGINRELVEYRRLAQAGLISTRELAEGEALLARRMREVEAAAKAEEGGLSRGQRAARLNLTRQGADVFTTAAMGMNPGMIAIQQGPQILDALSQAGIKVGPAMIAAGAGVTALAGAVLGLAAAGESASRTTIALDRAANGLGAASGLTGEQLQRMARAASDAGQATASEARDMAIAYVSTGRIGGEVLTTLIAHTRDYAAATNQDVPAATTELARHFSTGAQGLIELLDRFNAITPAEADHIRRLYEMGQGTDAQTEATNRLIPRIDAAADHLTGMQRAIQQLRDAAAEAWDWLGRMVDRAMGGGISAADRVVRAQRRVAEENARGPLGSVGGPDSFNRRAEAQEELRQAQAALQAERARNTEAARTQHLSDERAFMDRVDPRGAHRRELDDQEAGIRARLRRGGIDAAENARLQQGLRNIEHQRAADDRSDEGRHERHRRNSHAHEQALAREGASLQANAAGALAVAAAYLEGDDAAMRAAAARTAETRAARNGADAELRTRQQLNLAIAEAAVGGARSVANLRGQAEAQGAANDAVADSGALVADAQRQMQIDLQLRPLLTAQALAEGAARQQLTAIIARLRQGYRDLNEQQGIAQLLAGSEQDDVRQERSRLERRLVRATDAERAVALAEFDARQEVLKSGVENLDSPVVRDRLDAARQAAGEAAATANAQFLEQRRRQGEEALETAQAELSLVRAGAGARELVLARLRAEQELRARGIDLASAEAQADLDRAEAIVRIGQELQRQQGAWEEIRSTGSSVLDGLGEQMASMDQSWESWRTAGMRALQDIWREFIRLSAINPLKNMLFGQNNPTLNDAGGIFGFLRGLVGNGSAPASGGQGFDLSSLLHSIGGHAAGTSYSPGGLHWVGEFGRELVNLPRGSTVMPAGPSAALTRAANNNRPSFTYAPTFHAPGADAGALQALQRTVEAQGAEFSARLDAVPGQIVEMNDRGFGRMLSRG